MGEIDRRSLLKLLGAGAAGLGATGVVGRGLFEPAGATPPLPGMSVRLTAISTQNSRRTAKLCFVALHNFPLYRPRST